MIHRISANKESFREVVLRPGFNVVLADITKASTRKDSRNGLGKSTLIEIIHFCFGARAIKNQGLCVAALAGWAFTVTFDLGSRRVQVTRAVDTPNQFCITGDVEGLGEVVDGEVRLTTSVWRDLLGQRLFGLPPRAQAGNWSPTFRSTFAYTVRRGKSAFLSPFSNYKDQPKWNIQVENAFLIGLAWEDAQAVQHLREKKKAINALKNAAKAGVIDGLLGDVGQLEAKRVQLAEQAEHSAERLASFKVHQDYRQIEQRASELTTSIHSLSNANVIDTQRVQQLEQAMTQETSKDSTEQVVRLYQQAGAQLPGIVVEHLDAVKVFHEQVVENRRHFLKDQLQSIQKAIAARSDHIKALSDERADLLGILSKTGALEEYNRLQQRHLALVAKLQRIAGAIANLKQFEIGKSEITVAEEQLHQRALRDYEARAPTRERAMRLFNSHSQALYAAPGNLLMNVKQTGFTFDVQIDRATSTGVSAMQVFCYDLTLAELWAKKTPSPGFLVHDSLVFDGVDERQVGQALARAAEVCERAGFQYLCTINSDAVPTEQFPKGFYLLDHLRLRLTDTTPKGSLLGIRC